MTLSQSVEGCLESTIGGAGLPQTLLDKNLAKLEPRLESLREAYAKETLPLLRVPEWRDDITAAREPFQPLTKPARIVPPLPTAASTPPRHTLPPPRAPPPPAAH